MSDFTIEQLEALKEGATPGPWGIDSSDPDWPQLVGAVVLEGNLIRQEILAEVGGELNDPNLYLAAAAPDLVDALIAEKQARRKLRAGVQEMRDWYIARSQRMQSIYAETFDSRFADRAEYDENVADQLTEILEATDG